MPTYNCAELRKVLSIQVKSHQHIVSHDWKEYDSNKFLIQSAPDKWSAAQCLEHLNAYGRYYLAAIEKAIKAADKHHSIPTTNFKSGWLGNYFTNQMKVAANGYPKTNMTAPKGYRPSADVDVSKVLHEFLHQQQKLLHLIEESAKVNTNSIKIPITISQFVKLKLGDVLMFLVAHNDRHLQQAQRALDF